MICLHNILEKAKLEIWKSHQWLPEGRGGIPKSPQKGALGTFWDDGYVLYLSGYQLVRIYTNYSKITNYTPEKRINFTISKLYLDEI